MTVQIEEIIRMVDLAAKPIEMLPIQNDFRSGQLDMANMIKTLLTVIKNGK